MNGFVLSRAIMIGALVIAAIVPAAAQAGKLAIRNTTGEGIKSVFVSPIDVSRFGPDLLKGKTLANGKSLSLGDLPNGLYDMRVVSESGAECLLKDVDYFQYSVWTITPNCGAFGGTGG